MPVMPVGSPAQNAALGGMMAMLAVDEGAQSAGGVPVTGSIGVSQLFAGSGTPPGSAPAALAGTQPATPGKKSKGKKGKRGAGMSKDDFRRRMRQLVEDDEFMALAHQMVRWGGGL